MLTKSSWPVAGALVIGSLFAGSALCGSVLAQPPRPGAPAPKAAPAPKGAPVPKAKAKGRDAPPAPTEEKLETKDGWMIHATYFAGTKKKQAIPFIMLHGWEGQRGEYDDLAKFLQAQGHAVLAPDLRGHGQSTTRPGSDKQVEEPADLKKADLEAMMWDVEACKRFLRLENNKGECNVEALCVVAADFSSIIAMVWSAADWNNPEIASYKNGQDVKALVLLSPWQSHKGITLQKSLQHPAIRTRLSFLLIAGTEDSRGHSDTKKLKTTIEAFRPETKKLEPLHQDRTVVFFEPETNLSGTGLLNQGLRMSPVIGKFVELRLVDKLADYEWSERKSPREQ